MNFDPIILETRWTDGESWPYEFLEEVNRGEDLRRGGSRWSLTAALTSIIYRIFYKHKAVLEPRVSPDFAITYFCYHFNIRFENTDQSMWIHWPFFSKNLNQRSMTPRWPLTPCLLRSHVWLYPRIIVSKSHDNTSMYMYVDTVINFAKYHIHTHTTYRMSDHIVSYWTQFRRDKKSIKITKLGNKWQNYPKYVVFQKNTPFYTNFAWKTTP